MSPEDIIRQVVQDMQVPIDHPGSEAAWEPVPLRLERFVVRQFGLPEINHVVEAPDLDLAAQRFADDLLKAGEIELGNDDEVIGQITVTGKNRLDSADYALVSMGENVWCENLIPAETEGFVAGFQDGKFGAADNPHEGCRYPEANVGAGIHPDSIGPYQRHVYMLGYRDGFKRGEERRVQGGTA